MSLSIGETLSAYFDRRQPGRPTRPFHGNPHRTHAPVRRNCRETGEGAGQWESGWILRYTPKQTYRIIRAVRVAHEYGNALRVAASAEGHIETDGLKLALMGLTHTVVAVFEALAEQGRMSHGWIYPGYDHIKVKARCGRSTVTRALKKLERLALIERQGRFVAVPRSPGDGNPGKRYEQTTNLYRVLPIPAWLIAILPRWLREAPQPVDDAQRRQQERIEVERMKRDAADAAMDPALRAALASLGEAVADRECREAHNKPEPGPMVYSYEEKGAGLVAPRVFVGDRRRDRPPKT